MSNVPSEEMPFDEFGQEQIKFEPVTKPEDFVDKATQILSNTLDYLNHKLTTGTAESSDIRAALDYCLRRKIGIESTEELANKFKDQFEQDLLEDDEVVDESYRFQG